MPMEEFLEETFDYFVKEFLQELLKGNVHTFHHAEEELLNYSAKCNNPHTIFRAAHTRSVA